ncbi:MAG: polyprenyl synthetase family protein, partial [Deltaproteobacteria bacterium]|nr:polyprenyl synthetase family protein [Nannocystaceae bacterium]
MTTDSAKSAFDLDAWIRDRRDRVDAALHAALPDHDAARDPGRLRESMQYAVMLGGKRMRPLLTIAACEAAGGSVDQAMPAACAIEMVHAYSLVHDDLPAMDNDTLRRGKPTVHVEFGHDKAILCGDALLTLAFETLARGAGRGGRIVEAVVRMGHYAGIEGMVGGQAMDLVAGQDVRDLEALEAIHAKKTGALYAASGAMGALCAGADDERVARLEKWGMQFGIAFQHADDILDDDQVALRQYAIARVDALVSSCLELVRELGPGAEALRAIARWVH